MTRILDWLFPAATDARVSSPWAIYRHHLGGDSPYMFRYILQTPRGTLRLHGIRRSDKDQHLHDHPWAFWSLLLTGGYDELVPDRCVGQCARCDETGGYTRTLHWPRWSVVRHEATDLHRLVVDAPVWTLVWTGPRIRQWGFQTPDGWVYWRTYLGIPEADSVSRGEP